MKNFIKIAALASILSGCTALDSGTYPQSGNTGAPDAVTRNGSASPVTKTQTNTQAPAAGPQVADPSIDPATARSYQAAWEGGGFRHRSVMFPHIIDGCKVMVQSRRTLDYVGGAEGEFLEREGLDCNCDLVIDGLEDTFAQLNDSYKTPRMFEVCDGPGVDGATRQLEIMRESLKEQRNFDKMKNVEGF